MSETFRIARWSKANQDWEGLGVTDSIGVVSSVADMEFDANGDLYVVGKFVNIANVTGANYVAKYNIATGTWSSVGTGISGSYPIVVNAIAISPEGTIFIGGRFDTAGGNTNCNYIAYFDKTANDWRPLSTGLNSMVYTLKFAPDGRLLIGGNFTNATGTSGNHIWYRDWETDRKSTRLNSSHITRSRMPSSA